MPATASLPQTLTPYHAKYYAYELTRRCPPDSDDRLASALVDAQVDLNPHQIDAALFSFKSPLSRGVVLADEVERNAVRWFKPASGQFQITYRRGPDRPIYVRDFVAETETQLLIIETKARNEMATPEVAVKRQAAEEWCIHASAHAATYGGKPWRYALVPHDVVAENMSLSTSGRCSRSDPQGPCR